MGDTSLFVIVVEVAFSFNVAFHLHYVCANSGSHWRDSQNVHFYELLSLIMALTEVL